MEKHVSNNRQYVFHRLKITKKQQLTKNTFALELDVPDALRKNFSFKAGQYVGLKYFFNGETFINDFSFTSAPYEQRVALGIKINSETSSTTAIYEDYGIGDEIEVSEPKGRFTLVPKPHEFRTIVGFAAGIGITPILSHFKQILFNESRTRLYLFYGNKDMQSVAYHEELQDLMQKYGDRLQVHYFYSKEKVGNSFIEGRLDEKKLHLIINQVLHLDDTDEESTLWDAVDEVLICGKGEMIKAIANACYHNGIPKKNIHFELFEEFNEDIFPVNIEFPLVENINVSFTYNHTTYHTVLKDNNHKLLQSLSAQGYDVPFSCKSGICGTCVCKLEEGEVELLENEYLTDKEYNDKKILPCMSFALTENINLNFDSV